MNKSLGSCILIAALATNSNGLVASRNQLSQEEWMKLEQFYKNKPVLVTGGCGFIGSHLAEKLVELGAQVNILDNISTGSLHNIENIKDNVTLIEKDISDYDVCLQATRGQKIIFHQAAFVSVPGSMQDPAACHKTNIDGTFNLLEAARNNGAERFLFASSCSIYGDHEGICLEETNPNPISPYAISKVLGELYCKQFANNFGLPTVMLRYFNVYGSRQNPNGTYAAAVARFAYRMENNLPITINGDGTQTRDFVQVKQVVNANLMLGMLDAEKISGEIFNIASGKSLSIRNLITQMNNLFPNYNGSVEFGPSRPGDIKHSAADCSKYQQAIGDAHEKPASKEA